MSYPSPINVDGEAHSCLVVGGQWGDFERGDTEEDELKTWEAYVYLRLSTYHVLTHLDQWLVYFVDSPLFSTIQP